MNPNIHRERKSAPLTQRELSVLELLAKGLSTHQVALSLTLSRSTIRTHINHIHDKLGVSNRVQAITEALRRGLIAV